ncbi:MAG: helix-turn-helix transcriptional regulator [Clostridia bacterium]|nr:helix-turn-helix transcriptional regulator [Clostridia bacterium]
MNGSQINKLILQALADGDQYGLEIIKKIEDMTNGETSIKQPSLYSALSRMEKKGLISSFWQDSAIGGRRHYYSLTNLGKKEVAKSSEPISTPSPVSKESFVEPVMKEIPDPIINLEPVDELSKEEQVPEIIINKVEYEQFNPNENISTKQSFTQQMREYIEPDELNEEKALSPTPQEERTPESQSNLFFADTLSQETQAETIEDHKTSKDDINYKDILGDLDADLVEEPVSIKQDFTQTAQNQVAQEPQTPKKQSEYSKQIAEILRSDKKVKQENSPKKSVSDLYSVQNQALMDEINKRYHLGKDPANASNRTEPVHKIATNSVGYTHIKQDNITVKSYTKTDVSSFNSKNFLDKNKLNLCRAGIMTFIFLIELIVSYFILKDAGMIYEPHAFLYILYGVLGLVYFGIMLMLTLKDIHRKTRIKDINWAMDLLYRFMLAIVLITFVVAICLCLGMAAPLEIEFFTLWYIPLLAIIDLLLSWVVGIIIFATKRFRV